MTIADLEEQLDAVTAEAETARERAVALEQKIIAGDQNVSIADVQAEESKARYADLKVKNSKRLLDEAREVDRLNSLKAIRKEIETTELNADHLVDLLKAVEDASLAFIKASRERETLIQGWRNRLHALNAEQMRSGWAPPAEQFGIAAYPMQNRIRIDDRQVASVNARSYLDLVHDNPDPSKRMRDIYELLRLELGEK